MFATEEAWKAATPPEPADLHHLVQEWVHWYRDVREIGSVAFEGRFIALLDCDLIVTIRLPSERLKLTQRCPPESLLRALSDDYGERELHESPAQIRHALHHPLANPAQSPPNTPQPSLN